MYNLQHILSAFFGTLHSLYVFEMCLERLLML